MELEIPQLDVIEQKLDLAISRTGAQCGMWFTLEQAYSFKFGKNGPALSTIRNNLALQPRGGYPDDWAQTKKVWKRETVERWVLVTDSTLADYLAEVAPEQKVPEFITISNSKRTSITAMDIKRARKIEGGAV